jgi:hypothetical protein
MTRGRIFTTLAFSLALTLGVVTFAVTFQSAAFEAGEVLSAAELNELINTNFEAAKVAIEQNESAIAALQSVSVSLPFAGAADSAETAFSVTNTTGRALQGTSGGGIGVIGVSEARGVVGTQGVTSCAGTYAVGACATTGDGLVARATSGFGASVTSDTGIAVSATSGTAIGVIGRSTTRGVVGTQGDTSCAGTYGVGGCATTGDGVVGRSGSGRAGFFDGDVVVTGTLTKGAGSFQIDHPLDPTNRYLSHSFVESPDMINIYNGNVTLGEDGAAWVTLPEWFEALNRDFRYQLTAIGAPGPSLHVAATIEGNRFRIAGGAPRMTVSWQVTGIRQDPYAEANRIPVESWKPEGERGTLLHPEAYLADALWREVALDAVVGAGR